MESKLTKGRDTDDMKLTKGRDTDDSMAVAEE